MIEINGPNHYIAPSREETGRTEAKKRVLVKKGWNVISIPFFVNHSEKDPKLEDLLFDL